MSTASTAANTSNTANTAKSAVSFARKIDISAVRTFHSQKDIDVIVAIARQYRFINVHVLPCWVSYLAEQLKDDTDILPGAPVGFPTGAHTTKVKLVEAAKLIEDGVGEMDMVMNIGKFKNLEYTYVLDEMRAVREIAQDIPLKVIIEINLLSQDEMIHASELVIESGADYIKTGTGWVAGTANVDRLAVLKQHSGENVKIKAAGGIRTLAELQQLDALGIERFGINYTTVVEMMQELEKQ